LVSVYSEEQRALCNEAAEELRSVGVRCEVYFKSPKIGKQIDYAASREIPYILFIDPSNGEREIKDLKNKKQEKVSDLSQWAQSLGN